MAHLAKVSRFDDAQRFEVNNEALGGKADLIDGCDDDRLAVILAYVIPGASSTDGPLTLVRSHISP